MFIQGILEAVKIGVETVSSEQLIMGTHFSQGSLVHHDDFVGPANGGQAMGDNKGRAPLDNFFNGILDEMLRLCIDAGRCFIEDEDIRLVYESPGKTQKLALALGECGSSFGDGMIEALGKLSNKRGGIDKFRGFPDPLIADLFIKKGDIAPNISGKEEDILKNGYDTASEEMLIVVLDGVAINEDFTLVDVIKAGQ